MEENNTKTIRLTKDAYNIFHTEKKKLANLSKTPYTYSDVILASLSILEALTDTHREVVLNLLNKFKNARLKSKSQNPKLDMEEFFIKTVGDVKVQLSSKLLRDTIKDIIAHLIEKEFPEAAMEVLLTHAYLFDEHERNSLSFEILSAIADTTGAKIKERSQRKLDGHY